MKKRVLATILTVCLLFSVLACVASAEGEISIGEIISTKRICPGDVIDFDFIARPETEGGIYTEGWEVQTVDGVWVPYDGEPISEKAGTFKLRYFATDAQGNYAYSNECTVTAKHNPMGAYEMSGTDHWRTCADCGGQADKGGHDHLTADATASNKVCTVCGHVRTSQYTGILAFLEWVMNLIFSLIG
jgi:hypothetical protein